MADQNQPAKPEENGEEELLSWDFPEFVKYHKTRAWYVCASLAMAGLLAYAVFTANFLFAVFIILAAMVWFFQERREPSKISFSIVRGGIKLGGDFHQFKDLKNFWIIYEPPETKALYFNFKNMLKPMVFIGLEDQNPVKVRELLSKYVEEDKDRAEEPFSDHLRRKLKI